MKKQGLCTQGKLWTVKRMEMEKPVLKMELCSKDVSIKGNQLMESLFSTIVVITWEISTPFRLQGWAYTRMLQVIIGMRDSGKKTFKTGKELRSTRMVTSMKGVLCLGASLGRESINLQMGKSTRDRFTMGIQMGMGR